MDEEAFPGERWVEIFADKKNDTLSEYLKSLEKDSPPQWQSMTGPLDGTLPVCLLK
jgi:hypothetical protein